MLTVIEPSRVVVVVPAAPTTSDVPVPAPTVAMFWVNGSSIIVRPSWGRGRGRAASAGSGRVLLVGAVPAEPVGARGRVGVAEDEEVERAPGRQALAEEG